MLFSFTFGGRIPHPPIVLLFLSIFSCVVSYKKKRDSISKMEVLATLSSLSGDEAPGSNGFLGVLWDFVK